MTLTQLRYFQAACRCNGVTAAAEVLHISQPTVTAAIKELETEFGMPLLDRKKRSFALTEGGRLLLELSNGLLSHADQVADTMERLARKSRRLRLGVPPMIGALLLPRLYREFFSARPELDVAITEAGRRELLRLLNEGQLDLVFLPHDRPVDRAYHSVAVTHLETVLVVNPSHPMAKQSDAKIEDLANEPLVLFKNSFFQTETLLQFFQAKGITPRVLLYTDQLSTVRRLISSGIASGFLFRDLVSAKDQMVPIPLKPSIASTVSLVWKPGDVFQDMAHFIHYVQTI